MQWRKKKKKKGFPSQSCVVVVLVESSIFILTHLPWRWFCILSLQSFWTDFALQQYIVSFASLFYTINFVWLLLLPSICIREMWIVHIQTLSAQSWEGKSTATEVIACTALIIKDHSFFFSIKHLSWLSSNTSQNLILWWQTSLTVEMFARATTFILKVRSLLYVLTLLALESKNVLISNNNK